jgi:cystathionine beta-lyase/cystathionine gamma-synthase
MSHASIPAEVRGTRAFDADLVRLSIGVEDEEDLIGDLDQAFEQAGVKEGALATGASCEE